MKPIVKYENRIPFCRNEFLQDVSIDLGRRFKTVSAKVELLDRGDSELERLTVWLEDYIYGIGAGLAVSEDRTVWVCLFLRPSPNNPGYQISFYPSYKKHTPSAIATAFGDTFSIATRLCYGDSPQTLLRTFWKHTGKFEIKGRLPPNGEKAGEMPAKSSTSKRAKK